MNRGELRPCPFCGEKENLSHVQLANMLHYVQCERCGASPYKLGAWDYETSIKVWNREPYESNHAGVTE